MTANDIASAYSSASSSRDAANVLIDKLSAVGPAVVAVFAGHAHDGALITAQLKKAFERAVVIGCTTAGEFTEAQGGLGGVSAVALGGTHIKRASGALAPCGNGTTQGVGSAVRTISSALGIDLRRADPARTVGLVFIDGLNMREEAVNEALGNAAPLVSFVGGSAGDNLEFKRTRVFCNGEEIDDGAVLAVLETTGPFTVSKTCSFRSTGKTLSVTRADAARRTVLEFNGRNAVEAYAQAAGVERGKLDANVFMRKPVGLMIDDKPWIRSPQRVSSDGGLTFYCKIEEGMDVQLMETTDLIADTKASVEAARKQLGGTLSGGLAFNCILRRLELDAANAHGQFLSCLGGLRVAGFHTYGESWLGHINQTMTALWFA